MGNKHKISPDGDVAIVIDDDHAVTPKGEVVIKDNNGWVKPGDGKRYY